MKTKPFIKKPSQVISLTIIISCVLGLLLYGTIKLEEKIEKKMLDISTFDVISIARNNAHEIEGYFKESNNYIQDIKEKESLVKKN